ncbi:MAG: hypothetical protein P8186_10235 [Anaerolineae bacterium]|jgi:hypothetical protein
MTEEVRFALQLGLNLAAVLLAGWLAGRYAARQVQKILEAERQRAQAARRQIQAEVVANLPPIPPELEQMVEIERWVLAARDLQLLLTSLCTLIRIGLRADETGRRGVLAEIDRSLQFMGRQENKWLNASLPVVAYVRHLDPAKGKTPEQSLETWVSRLNRAHVQAAQSLRRAASLCDPDQDEEYGNTLANVYLTEADRATSDMAGVVTSTLDRVAYLRKQLPELQAQQVAAAVTGPSMGHSQFPAEDDEDKLKGTLSSSSDPHVDVATSESHMAR